MAPLRRRPLGRSRTRHRRTPAAWLWSLSVYVLRTSPGLLMIVSGVVAGPFTTGRARLAAAIVIALGAATYAEQCHRTPYAECWHCGGLGYRRRYRPRILAWIIGPPSTRCRPCRGRGVRMRWGRALMNAYRRATFTPPGTPDPAPIPNPADAAGPIDVTDAARRAYALDPTRATRPPAP